MPYKLGPYWIDPGLGTTKYRAVHKIVEGVIDALNYEELYEGKWLSPDEARSTVKQALLGMARIIMDATSARNVDGLIAEMEGVVKQIVYTVHKSLDNGTRIGQCSWLKEATGHAERHGAGAILFHGAYNSPPMLYVLGKKTYIITNRDEWPAWAKKELER